ncbi:MAG: hypothetical protein HDT29_04720 [Clostridiales bacterium]|nr:hypothetical protein [Clostridiales bacterium]
MKKYAKIITAILLVTLLALTFVACIDPDNDSQGTMTLVLLNGDDAKEYTVDLSKIPSDSNQTGLMAVLDYLQSDGQLTYTEEGGLLTKVGDLINGVDGKYIYIYTDVESDFDVSEYAVQITYKEKSYTNSGWGASQTSVKDGCTIVITYLIWG